jgi:FkbM family methyltransferase
MKQILKYVLNKLLRYKKLRFQILMQIIKIDNIKSIKFGKENLKYFPLNKKWIEITTDLGIFPFFYNNGNYEIEIPQLIIKHLNNQKKYVFIDAGANMGLISLQLFNLDNNKMFVKFILIDPNPNVHDILNYNSLNLTNSIVIPKAISSNKNSIKFYINENDSDNSDATLVSDIGTEENKKVIEVETINLNESLHSYLHDITYDALVYKSDLQGYDLIAFSEFTLDIINKIELAIIEVYPKYFINHYGTDSSNQILKLLNSYSKIYIIEGHKVIEIEKNKFLDYFNKFESNNFFNLLLLK